MSDAEPRDETAVQEPEETDLEVSGAAPGESPEAVETTERPPARPPHGWMSLYLVAFVLLLVSGVSVALAARSFLQSIAPLYLSMGLSVVAAGLAVIAVALPKRGG